MRRSVSALRDAPLALLMAISLASPACSCSEEDDNGTPGAGGDGAGGGGAAGGAVDEAGAEPDVVVPDSSDEPTAVRGDCAPLAWAGAHGASGSGDLFAAERALAVAAIGDSLVFTGSYEGAIDFGGGPLTRYGDNRALFVLFTDAAGNHQKSMGFGDSSSGLLFAPQATGLDVAATPNGGAIITGSFAGAVDFGTGVLASTLDSVGFDAGTGCLLECAPDAFVLALDAMGETDWALGFGGAEGDAASAVVVDAAGGIFVGGSFRGTLELDGGHTVSSRGGSDGFVLALDASGSALWITAVGGPGDDTIGAISVGDDGTVLAGGTLTSGADLGEGAVTVEGDNDAFVVALDASGALTRSRLFGGLRGAVTGLATRRETVIAVGSIRGAPSLAGETFATNRDDAFVVALETTFEDSWARVFGTRQNDQATGVSIAPAGSIWVTGSLGFGVADLGGGRLATNVSDGAFLLEVDTDGAHRCSRRHLAESLGEAIADAVTLGASLDALDVAVTGDGAVVWAGSLTGETTIDGVRVTSSGSSDVFNAAFFAP